MLIDLFPRAHVRYTCLALLGTQLDGLARWLAARGFPAEAIRERIRKAPILEALLLPLGKGDLGQLSREQLLALAPRPARDNPYLSALVRSLAAYLDELGLLRQTVATPGVRLVSAYLDFLGQVRGYAASTLGYHGYTVRELLAFLRFDDDPAALQTLAAPRIEAFMQSVAARCGQAGVRQTATHLRSFLRFLAGRGEVADGLDACIDTARVYRDEQLPKALPWETVQAFLADIDRTTAIGRRDYAMFLLMATYGLRSCEIAALRLDSVAWRAAELRVPCPKARQHLVLPLTDEVGAALVDYLRNARRPASCRSPRPAYGARSGGGHSTAPWIFRLPDRTAYATISCTVLSRVTVGDHAKWRHSHGVFAACVHYTRHNQLAFRDRPERREERQAAGIVPNRLFAAMSWQVPALSLRALPRHRSEWSRRAHVQARER